MDAAAAAPRRAAFPSPPPDAPPLVPRKALVASTPTTADGVPPEDEAAATRELDALIATAGAALSLNPAGLATAASLAHHFYAARSMCRNDRVAVAGGALFLAAKLEETPRTLNSVVAALQNAGLPARPGGEPAPAAAADAVLTAERALLYASGFRLGLEHPFRPLLPILAAHAPAAAAGSGGAGPAPAPHTTLAQQAWNLVAESTPTRVAISHPPEAVAGAAFVVALRAFAAAPRAGDVPWWADAGAAPADVADAVDALLGQYEEAAGVRRTEDKEDEGRARRGADV